MNKQELINLLKENQKIGQLDWKSGVELTKKNQTLLKVVKNLADK